MVCAYCKVILGFKVGGERKGEREGRLGREKGGEGDRKEESGAAQTPELGKPSSLGQACTPAPPLLALPMCLASASPLSCTNVMLQRKHGFEVPCPLPAIPPPLPQPLHMLGGPLPGPSDGAPSAHRWFLVAPQALTLMCHLPSMHRCLFLWASVHGHTSPCWHVTC